MLREKLLSYGLLAENHKAVWKYLAQTTTEEELQKIDKITELLQRGRNIKAIIRFMDDQKLYLPKNLRIDEIMKFREEGASIEFRKFLEKA